MNQTDQDASGAFPAAAGTSTLSSGPEQAAALRRRHWRRTTLVLAAAVAVAAGGTAALLARSASDPPSPLAALTGALARTSQENYRFRLNVTVLYAGTERSSVVVSGALDPGHERGTELLAVRLARYARDSRTAWIRFTGKYVYTRVSAEPGPWPAGKPWDKAPVPAAGALPLGDLYGFVSDWPVSPDELRAVLRQSAATARDAGPASGPGWTGTRYSFTARLSPRSSLSGIVYVDNQGRARRLVTTTTEESRVTTYRNLIFAGFGTPVPVTVPPASQIHYTSTPYWGFYF